jgi:hypothetical protein
MYNTLTRDLSPGITSLLTVLDLFCPASSLLSTELISTLNWLTDLVHSVSYNWQLEGIEDIFSKGFIRCFIGYICNTAATKTVVQRRTLLFIPLPRKWLLCYRWSMRSNCRRCLAMDIRFDSYNQAFRQHATLLFKLWMLYNIKWHWKMISIVYRQTWKQSWYISRYCGVFTPCKNRNIETRSRYYTIVDKAVFSPCCAEDSRPEPRRAEAWTSRYSRRITSPRVARQPL